MMIKLWCTKIQNSPSRLEDLLKRMTLKEKIGQMMQLERKNLTAEIMKVKQYGVGSLLSGGGSWPCPNASAKDWIIMVNEFQRGSVSTRLGIPMFYGIDVVHGNYNNVYNATIFPITLALEQQALQHIRPFMTEFLH
ncbi:Glycosyl hydrolase family protein [Heracleum sosnowskyi]|uniref:Glycosyl hydrolase family protein n=1 Tax=Heracleum sosnowskyi TaxID=360622 RepID=A0AAD8GTN5_9APIA|nr:Glycosyl hydrolase family protein [Heracleum sosnowskyi]